MMQTGDPLQPYIDAAETCLVVRDAALKQFLSRRATATSAKDIKELDAAIAVLRYGVPPNPVSEQPA